MTGRQTVEEGKINRLYPRKISILFDASNIPDTIYHLRPILYFPVVTLGRRVSGARREQLPWSYTVLQKKICEGKSCCLVGSIAHAIYISHTPSVARTAESTRDPIPFDSG